MCACVCMGVDILYEEVWTLGNLNAVLATNNSQWM